MWSSTGGVPYLKTAKRRTEEAIQVHVYCEILDNLCDWAVEKGWLVKADGGPGGYLLATDERHVWGDLSKIPTR